MNDEFLDIMALGREKPNKFVEEILGKDMWDKQKEIIDAVFKYPRVCVKSCNSAGKSYTASTLALTALYTHFDSIVLTTAPTGNQVFNVMWREIRGSHTTAKIPLGGELLKQSLSLSDNWYAMGFSTDNPENARGFHARGGYLLYIIDEASGVAPDILDAIEGTLTTNETRLLYIGNPTIASGKFYEAFSSEFFHKISIPVWDTPNFIANNIKSAEDLEFFDSLDDMETLDITHPYLVTPQWAYMRMHDWGVDSPMFQSLVEAQFPTEGERMLIPLHYIQDAIKKEWTEEEEKENTLISIGVDVAKGNFGDSSVIVAMKGMEMIDVEWSNSRDPMELVGMIINMFNKLGGRINFDIISVDDTSLGGGVAPRLSEQGYRVNAISFGGSPTVETDTQKFTNIKAQMFWQLREVFRERRIQILDKGKLVRHLSMMQYLIKSDAKIGILGKDEMKKQGYESSDFADALALAVHGVFSYNQSSVPMEVKKGKTISGNLFNTQL